MRVAAALAKTALLAFATLSALVDVNSAHAADEALPLRWGADAESGAPYAYKNPKNPNEMVGFEAEFVQELARRLKRPLQFVQNNWEGLSEGLERGDYDIAVNGLEITPERSQKVLFSSPYYYTGQVLTVRKDNTTIHTLADLAQKKVGTLASSLAQRMLAAESTPMEVRTYSEELHLYNDLAVGRLDAVFLDEAIALYYGQPNPLLKIVSAPDSTGSGEMLYGVAIQKSNEGLQRSVNKAIADMIKDGSLRMILERWGLWNGATARAWSTDAAPRTPATKFEEYLQTAWKPVTWTERLERYWGFLPLLGQGAVMTLQISVLSMILAMALGLMMAVGRLYGPAPLRYLTIVYVEIFRGTPLLIQLFLIFYGLPYIGIRLDPFLAAVLGLGLNYAACESENYRAGILSIPKSQMDASFALGMTRRQALRHIILPQAMRVVIPPVTNDFIALLKDSSLVSIITMVELTSTYGQLASTYFDYLGIGLLTAAVYFLIGLPFVRLSRYFEKSLSTQFHTRFRFRKPNGVAASADTIA
jgi:polar amino acid transport system substrate-binding protein